MEILRIPITEEDECTKETLPNTNAPSTPLSCPSSVRTIVVYNGIHNARFQRLNASACLSAEDISDDPTNPEEMFSDA